MMAHAEIQEEETPNTVEDMTEEQFLKDLYVFMKKRDTPIERIPNLGFKQIDLFVMFKTVNDLGGYHQVTSHQMWKQVYNVLGGNPRSTSAATCTRRHYERLLLPYECHLKGVIMSAVPQAKPYHERDDDESQKPSKRRLLSHQRPYGFHSDPYLYPLPYHFPPYYHPAQALMPPVFPVPPPMLAQGAVPGALLSFPPPPSNLDVDESVKKLRLLAEEYKSTSGRSEPLNLSLKESSRDSRSPVSSFSPPAPNKQPKFLNKVYTLYTACQSGVAPGERSGESAEDDSGFCSSPGENRASSVEAGGLQHSPTRGSLLTQEADRDSGNSSHQENRPEGSTLNLNHILQRLPQSREGHMEIEVPLSVFRSWLKLCGTPAGTQDTEVSRSLDCEERSGSDTSKLPTDLTVSTKHLDYCEDLSPSRSGLSNYRRLTPGVSKQDTWPCEQLDSNNQYTHWRGQESSDPSPLRAVQDFTTKFCKQLQGGQDVARTRPSGILMSPKSPLVTGR